MAVSTTQRIKVTQHIGTGSHKSNKEKKSKLKLSFITPSSLSEDSAIYGVQECYVCRPDGEPSPELEKQFPNVELPICGVKAPERKTCPTGSKGCLTQYEGDRVTKSCTELSLNDCSQANRVKYCYCGGTLCNKEEKTITITSETDDEDLSEGSGDTTTTVTTQPTTTITTTKPTIKTHTASSSSILKTSWLTIAIIIYFFQYLK